MARQYIFYTCIAAGGGRAPGNGGALLGSFCEPRWPRDQGLPDQGAGGETYMSKISRERERMCLVQRRPRQASKCGVQKNSLSSVPKTTLPRWRTISGQRSCTCIQRWQSRGVGAEDVLDGRRNFGAYKGRRRRPQSDSKVRCTGWGHVYLQLCIFGVSLVFRCIY